MVAFFGLGNQASTGGGRVKCGPSQTGLITTSVNRITGIYDAAYIRREVYHQIRS
jgi:hypothetical protein